MVDREENFFYIKNKKDKQSHNYKSDLAIQNANFSTKTTALTCAKHSNNLQIIGNKNIQDFTAYNLSW